MRKRIIAALMTLCMALSLLPGQVLAAGVAQTGGAETAKGTGRVYVNEPDAQVALLQRTMQNPVTDEAALGGCHRAERHGHSGGGYPHQQHAGYSEGYIRRA